jgi:hypothetical protein
MLLRVFSHSLILADLFELNIHIRLGNRVVNKFCGLGHTIEKHSRFLGAVFPDVSHFLLLGPHFILEPQRHGRFRCFDVLYSLYSREELGFQFLEMVVV